jgi:precorrin-6x reductase
VDVSVQSRDRGVDLLPLIASASMVRRNLAELLVVPAAHPRAAAASYNCIASTIMYANTLLRYHDPAATELGNSNDLALRIA